MTPVRENNEWRRFFASEPGSRFQERYHRHRVRLAQRSKVARMLFLILGGLSTAVGFIMLVTPGPGVLFIAIGAGLVGNESLIAARFFDWIEMRIRSGIGRFRRWRQSRTAKNR